MTTGIGVAGHQKASLSKARLRCVRQFPSDSPPLDLFSHPTTATTPLQESMDVDRAQLLEQYRAKIREHREVELRYVRE